MKLVVTAITSAALLTTYVEAECKCTAGSEQDSAHLNTKFDCCSYINAIPQTEQEHNALSCAWIPAGCAGWQALAPQQQQLQAAPQIRNYPPFFQRQPPHSISCVYANYQNIAMYAANNVNGKNLIPDSTIIAMNDVVKRTHQDEVKHANGEITNMKRYMFNYLFPLMNLRTYPGFIDALLASESIQPNRGSQQDYLFNENTGGVTKPITWQEMLERANNPRFVGFVLEVQSSNIIWSHDVAIVKDPRWKQGDSPKYWHLDPGFPVIDATINTPIKWTLLPGKKSTKNGITRVGITADGLCAGSRWCSHGEYDGFRKSDFELMASDNKFDFNRWRFQGSQRVDNDQALLARFKALIDKKIPTYQEKITTGYFKNFRQKYTNNWFLKHVHLVFKPTDEELFTEFTGIKWSKETDGAKFSELVQYWPDNVMRKVIDQWTHEYQQQPQEGYWAPPNKNDERNLAQSKAKNKKLFTDQLLKISKNANPAQLSIQNARLLKQFEIAKRMPIFKRQHSPMIDHYLNYYKPYYTLNQVWNLDIFIMISCLLILCGCLTVVSFGCGSMAGFYIATFVNETTLTNFSRNVNAKITEI